MPQLIHRSMTLPSRRLGKNPNSSKEQEKLDHVVERKVKEIVDELKTSHEKFCDPDFGPNDNDPYGAQSLYGSAIPAPSGGKYPSPDTLSWLRPLYDDEKFLHTELDENNSETASDEEDEFGFIEDTSQKSMCQNGKLFLDGTSSGDVVQGQLGDCWFLGILECFTENAFSSLFVTGALAVMGAHEELLKNCFWRRDEFKEHGLFVVRFFKDCNVIFVIIDDRLPVKSKDSKLVFASCKDPNELWVPLIEKAYAKLHGCYKALIGGYAHFALGDMTGYCPRLLVLKPGYTGFAETYSEDQIWSLLRRYKAWNCLMGCSIQSNPKDNQKVEAEAGLGLYYGHAYSLLDLNEITLTSADASKGLDNRIVKIRNPWGRGEWEGAFSDSSDERTNYENQLKDAFERDQEKVIVANDGTFFMPFREWFQRFTSLFVAITFPSGWSGQYCKGSWSGDVGGNRLMGTWVSNPKIKLLLSSKSSKNDIKPGQFREVFIGIYIRDSRLTMGADYYKDPLYATPLSFDIIPKADVLVADPSKRSVVHGSQHAGYSENTEVLQPPYNFGTTQTELKLKTDEEYYIVPSLYKRNQGGEYYITVYADVEELYLEGGTTISEEHRPMVIGKPTKSLEISSTVKFTETKPSAKEMRESSNSKEYTKRELKMTIAQFYEKKELFRKRLIAETKRLHLSLSTISTLFSNQGSLPVPTFKRRMIDLGFNLADFPDDDLIVLDEDNNGSISQDELITFMKTGFDFLEGTHVPAPPPTPVDDLLLKASDMEGIITVSIISARNLREAYSWLNALRTPEGKVGPSNRKILSYDSIAATQWWASKNKTDLTEMEFEEADLQETEIQSPSRNRKASTDTTFEDDRTSVSKFYTTTDASIKFGNVAVNKQHLSPALQRAEILRTSKLLQLKKMYTAQENSIQISEALIKPRAAVYDIKSKIIDDNATMRYLNYRINNDGKSQMLSNQVESLVEDEEEFWDYLIDSVVNISLSRGACQTKQNSMILSFKNCKNVPQDNFLIFDSPPMKIADSNSGVRKKSLVPGTTPTSINSRKLSGSSSIISNRKIASVGIENGKGRLTDSQSPVFYEVFRRLVTIPVCDSSELQGCGSTSKSNMNPSSDMTDYLRNLFANFDKNGDGTISYDEFKLGMKSMNIDMSDDECHTLFRRFDTNDGNNSIDYSEFISFFNHKINSTSLSKGSTARSIYQILRHIHQIFECLNNDSKLTVDSNLKDKRLAEKGQNLKQYPVISSLSVDSASANIAKLKIVGVSLSLEEMQRISRSLGESVSAFNNCIRNMSNLSKSLEFVEAIIRQSILVRCGGQGIDSGAVSAAHVKRLWNDLSLDDSQCAKFETICDYFSLLVEEAIHSSGSEINHSCNHGDFDPHSGVIDIASGNTNVNFNSSVKGKAISSIMRSLSTQSQATESPACCSILGIPLDFLSRMIADGLFTSHWNLSTESNKLKAASVPLTHRLSFSGFEAFIRDVHVDILERKLRYLCHVGLHAQATSIYCFTHVYFSSDMNNINVIVHEPICGDVIQLQLSDDSSSFPTGDKLRRLISQKFGADGYERQHERTFLYNAYDTPYENEAIMNMIKRLRIVRYPANKPTLILAENPKFIIELKKIVQGVSSDLPFFVSINDLTLSFEVNESHLILESNNSMPSGNDFETSVMTLEKFVFRTIRKCKQFHKFLTSVSSSLNVLLSTFNGRKYVCMTWNEMLSYLLDYKNPFLTVQLLPKFLEPCDYFYRPDVKTDAYIGDEYPQLEEGTLHKSEVNFDGGKCPTWNATFKLKFRPPRLTSCRVLSTETAKLKIDGVFKYVLVMVRQGTTKIIDPDKCTEEFMTRVKADGSFLFLTIYDPRSSTEYQCGVKKESRLYDVIFTSKLPSLSPRPTPSKSNQSIGDSSLSVTLSRISRELEEAVKNEQIIVGPAITPRLLIDVYNQRGREEDFIGSSQLSISSALSGSGITKARWVTLNRITSINDTNVLQPSGEILVDISFRKLAEINAEKKSSEDRLERLKSRSQSDIRSKPYADVNLRKDSDSMQSQKLSNIELEEKNQQDKDSPIIPNLSAEKSKEESFYIAKLEQLNEYNKKLSVENEQLEMEKKNLLKELNSRDDHRKNDVATHEINDLKNENSRLQKELERLRNLYEKSVHNETINEILVTSDVDDLEKMSHISSDKVNIVPLNRNSQFLKDSKRSLTFNEQFSSIITALKTQTEKGMTSTTSETWLDSFERLLKANSNDNLINSQSIVKSFSAVSIEVTNDFAETLIQRVGKPLTSTRDHVTYQSLVSFLRRRNGEESQLTSINSNNGTKTTLRSSRPSTPEVNQVPKRKPTNKGDVKNEVSMPIKSAEIAVVPKNADTEKIKVASAQFVDLNDDQNSQKNGENVDKPNPTSINASRVTSSKDRPKSHPTDDSHNELSIPNHSSTSINWNEVPLPSPSWERKVDSRSQRVYYVNHEMRSTQWHHPLNTAVAMKSIQKRSASETMSAISNNNKPSEVNSESKSIAMSSTAPVRVKNAWS